MLSDKLKQVALKSKQLYQEKYPAALEENNCDALRFGLETLLAERHQLECELYRESRRFTLRIVRFFAKASVRLAYTRGPRGTLRGCDFIVPVTLRVTGTFIGFKKITASQSDSDGRGFEVQRN